MKKPIAVQGFSWQFSDPNVQATVVLTGVPSLKSLAGGKNIAKDGFGAMVTAVMYPSAGATIPDPGPYNVSFNATAQKNKADGSFVLREGDETGTINATPKIPAGTAQTPYPVSFKLQITSAGQAKASGE
jgi:hypothetical protein